MAPIVPFLPAIIGAVPALVGTVGGLIQGNKDAKQNEQYIQGQDKQFGQIARFAEQLASSVNRAEYDAQANQDVNRSLQDVFGAMAQRGMGRSTAGLTAAADASGKIRSTYTQQYLQDRLSAIQGAGNMLSGVANAPRQGFNNNPFAGFQSGLTGLGNAAGLAVSPLQSWLNGRNSNGMPGLASSGFVPTP